MTEERTPLQDLERRALTGNRSAVMQVISALRKYRAATIALIDRGFYDGKCDDSAVDAFVDAIAAIEEDVEEPT